MDEQSIPTSDNSNKRTWILVLVVLLLVALYASNPSLEDHRDAVKSKVTQLLQKSISDSKENNSNAFDNAGSAFGAFLGSAIIDKFVDEMVYRKNFLLFSLTTVEYGGEEKVIGVGVLGNVFISDEIQDRFRDAEGEKTGYR